MINFRELVKKGVHFGHQTSRWCPKMRPYIWGVHNKTHLFDVSKTAYLAEKSKTYLEQLSSEGKSFLWVGTKRAAQEPVHRLANEFNMPYVIQRWVGGTLSNFSQVKKSVTKLLHLEDVLAKTGNNTHYTKKELGNLQKVVTRLEKSVGGLRRLNWPISAIIVVDVTKEMAAIKEARQMNIPVIAIVDTNGDPSLVDFVIPANDDATQSIDAILGYLAEGIRAGKSKASESANATLNVTIDANEQEGTDIATAVLTLSSEEETTENGKKKPFKKTPGNIKPTPGMQKRTSKKTTDEE